jgi:hypothetical protein
MFNTLSRKGNANQNYTKIPFGPSQTGHYQENKQQMLARIQGKGTLTLCWWECKVMQSLWKSEWRFLRKLRIDLLYDPAIPLLGM